MTQKHEISSFIIIFGLMVASGHAAVFAAEGSQAEQQSAKASGAVVARVNGQPIYEEQMNTEFDKNWNQSKKLRLQKESPDVLKQLQRKALDTIIDSELISQESRKLKIDDVDQRIEQRLKDLEAKYGAGEGVEKYLKHRSLTVKGYKKAIRAKVYLDEYLKQQGISEPDIPEEDIRKMYEENPKSFARDECVKVSHILIAADAHTGAEAQEQARQKAEKIRAEIVQGKDFAEMAIKHSNCNSASGGGDLGFVKKGFMPKEFDRVAFTLDKGAISEVVKTKFGYHIIKVFEKQPAGVAPYKEIRDFLRKYLQTEESKKKLASHLVDLKKKAKIEVLLK